MKIIQVFRLFLIIAVAFSTFQGCEESPTQPQIGPGNVLKATIEGAAYEFNIEESLSEYDVSLLFGEFSGSTDAPPVQSITVSFNADIDKGPFPKVLTGGDVTLVVVTSDDVGVQRSYLCPVLDHDCRITITASNGEIVDGTFSGTLENSQDENDRIAVTNGEFSVKLTRN